MNLATLLIIVADLAAIDLVIRIGRRLRWAALLKHRLAWLQWEGAHAQLLPSRPFPG
jgi:hypothetical protein